MAKVPTVPSPDTPLGKSDEDNVDISIGANRKNSIYAEGSYRAWHVARHPRFRKGDEGRRFPRLLREKRRRTFCDGDYDVCREQNDRERLSSDDPADFGEKFRVFWQRLFQRADYDPETDEIYQMATADKESRGEKSKDQKFLVGTAEPSLLAYYSDDVLKEEELPIKVCGYSQCYRSEIGSYGKDVKGMYRVHEFMKVEQVVIAPADVDMMNKLQDEMTGISGEMHEELGLPYRRLQICTGDMSAGKYRAFDLEAWLPGMNRWAETGSASSFLDWQSRRLNIKYADKGGNKKYAYLLNNTALPSPRIFIAILENYQTADGKVVVPEVLQKYVGKKIIGVRRGFIRLQFLVQRPAVCAARMLDQHHRGPVRVVGCQVGHGSHIHVGFNDHALADLHMMQCAPAVAVRHLHAHRLVGGVGEQPLLAGMNRIEQALAGKLAGLEDGKAARVERQLGFVFQPYRAQRRRLPLAPQRDVLGGKLLLQDRHHRRLVLVDGDRRGQRVLEEVVEGVGGDVALFVGIAGAIHAAILEEDPR